MPFDPAKTKKLYQNGISYKKETLKSKSKKPELESFDEWPILEPTGNLIGFIKLESDSDLPNEIWIRDKKYKLSEKISKD